MTLPILGDDFVKHQLEIAGRNSKRKFDPTRAKAVFETFDHSPLFFNRWLTRLMIEADLTSELAIDSESVPENR